MVYPNFLAFPRFWSKVSLTGIDRCWFWKRSTKNKGYGQFGYNGHTVRPHRLAYELMIGEIPDGLEPDHVCRQRSCVNPYHLELVTHKENMRRGDHKSNHRNTKKTHCLNGHKFDGDNLYISASGSRMCRTCCQRRSVEYRARKKIEHTKFPAL